MTKIIKNGFLIVGNEIYDTKIQSYTLEKEDFGANIIYFMNPNLYKRLYLFEPLLYFYNIETVFKILVFNKYLKRQREKEILNNPDLECMYNISTLYEYAPTYLTQRKFSLYKKCQKLKKLLD